MKASLLAGILAHVAGAVALPDKPDFTYLYSVDLTAGGSRLPGPSPVGNRTTVFHSGGVFEGPKLKGLFAHPDEFCFIPQHMNTDMALSARRKCVVRP